MQLYKFNFEELSPDDFSNPDIQNFIHHALFEVNIQRGRLVCNNCQKMYFITNGVADFVLEDNEVE